MGQEAAAAPDAPDQADRARWSAWRAHRTEAVVVAVATMAVFAAYAWSAWYWIDLVDEGYFLYLADRVRHGELPYRDFDTYYTPGVFWLYAAALDLFGVSVIPVRLLMAGLRTLCGLLLYVLARQLVPWPFALLPSLAVAAMDAVPIHPEPHPAWWAMVAWLLALASAATHAATGRLRWIVLAGVAAAVAFAFKQNVGAFTALAVGGYLLLRPRDGAGWLVRLAQAVYAVLLGAASTVLLWPAFDERVAVTLWLPLLATLALLLWRAWTGVRPSGWVDGLGEMALECVVAGAAFVGATLVWLVPLVVALGVAGTPFGLFVGAGVNQGALIMPLSLPPRATREVAIAAIWVPLGAALLFGRGPRGRAGRLLAVGLGLSLLVPLLPVMPEVTEALVEDPEFYPWVNTLNVWFSTLFLYLPALGAWAGLAIAGARIGRGESVGPIPWYLLFGTVGALAIYPRSDFLHVRLRRRGPAGDRSVGPAVRVPSVGGGGPTCSAA